MSEIKRDKKTPTKTTLFLVPVLGFNIKELKNMGFVNAYSMMKDRIHKDCVYMLFLVKDEVKLGEFIEGNKDKIADEIDFDKGYTVLVCPFPVKFIHDKQHFWQGGYSLLSKDFRNFFSPDILEHRIPIKIMNKDKELRSALEERISLALPKDCEVASIPYKEYETLDIDLFLNEDI